jgi:magnesium transporter
MAMMPATPALQEVRQQVTDLLESRNLDALLKLLKTQHPADIADVIDLLEKDQRVAIFSMLQNDIAAEVLDETRTEVTRNLVEAIPDEQIADLLESMPMDDAAEVLSELEADRAEDLIGLMQPVEAAEVERLLAYPEDSAGRLMTTKVVRIGASWTIQQALERLRTIDPEVETRAYLYVVNGNRQLVGIVPVWDILTSAPDKLVSDVMEPEVTSVRVDADQEKVAHLVSQYDYFAIPVVDEMNRFLGIITHDDVIDILQEEFTEDVQRFGGAAPLEFTYLSAPIIEIVRKRVGWLILLILTATLTGTVMRLFESDLEKTVALSFFIPLLIGTGGNAGSQVTATMIRALAVGEIHFKDIWLVIGRELATGLLLGLAMGAVGLVRAVTWGTSLAVGLTVAASLCTLVVWANLMGVVLPLLASRLRIDPTVISGPVMSTLVDATGLLIYFSLARLIIGLFV